MENYILQYDNLSVTYEMEGDCDGNHAIIQSVVDESGNAVEIDSDTERDVKFHAEQEFSQLQWDTYMKTGNII